MWDEKIFFSAETFLVSIFKMQKLNFHLSEVHRIETSRFERLALNCFVRLINIVINLPQILYMILGHWLAICYLWWNLYLCVIVMSLAKEKVICTHPFHLLAKMANNPDHRVNYNSIIQPLPYIFMGCEVVEWLVVWHGQKN